MPKRRRFFVELKEGEVTVISWKKLVADAERLCSDLGAHETLAADLHKSSSKLELTASSCATVTSETAENRLHGSPHDEDMDFSCSERRLGKKTEKQKSNGNVSMDSSMEVAKNIIELDDDAEEEVGLRTLKGKVHRATPTACDPIHANTNHNKMKKKTCSAARKWV